MRKRISGDNNLGKRQMPLCQVRRSGPPKPEATIECPDGLDDEGLFQWAMRDVTPIPQDDRPSKTTGVLLWAKADPLEEMFRSGASQLVWNLQPDHIEAAHPSVSRGTLRKLRQGHFSVRAECDLHGMTQREARRALTEFIEGAARGRLGCVRVIHGKGKNSLDKIPVLKSRLQDWLAGRRLSRYVLAYSSARPCDGGTGAIYVLLRKV